MNVGLCPQPEALRQYAEGSLPEPDAESVADHLSDCAVCDKALRRIENEEVQLVSGLRSAAAKDPFAKEPDLRAALKVLAQLRLNPPGPDVDSAVLANLSRVFADYRIEAKIGEGGMGQVYKAVHIQLDKTVAIKVLPPDRTRDESAVARFRREIKAAGKLDHPNIVNAHHAGEVDGTPFLVMQFVDGVDLSNLVRRRGPLAVADACELIRQAALGLDHAHRHGLVHRDIKPSNLMLTTGGQVKILDLGLALLQSTHASDEQLTADRIMGTADYMSPEQAGDSHAVDIRADIYSLGCTLYKLLTGKALFSGSKYGTTLKKSLAHLTEPPPTVRADRPDVSPELAALLDRMLAKDPGARFQTPAQLAEALASFALGSNLLGLSQQLELLEQPERTDQWNPETDPFLMSAMTGTKPDQQPLPVEASGVRSQGSTNPAPEEAPSISPILVVTPPVRRRQPPKLLVGLGCLAAAIALATIIIVIKNRKGEVVGQVEVPEGNSAVVLKDGKEVATTEPPTQPPREGDPPRRTAEPPTTPQPAVDKISTKTTAPPTPNLTPVATTLSSEADTAIGPFSLVSTPAEIAGVKKWTIQTRNHRGPITKVRYSPNGIWVGTLGQDHALRIWDAKTWQLVRIIEGTTASFDWSPDSREIVAGAGGNKIGIWSVEAGQLLRAWNIRGKNVVDTSWARKGGRIAVRVIAVNYGIEVFRADSGEALAQIDTGASSDLAWSPDGETLAFASMHDVTLVRWSAKDGNVNRDIQGEQAMESISWSHDGKRIAARTYSNEPTLFVWENATGRELYRDEKILGLSTVAFSPAMNHLAKARYLTVEIVDLDTKHVLQQFDTAPNNGANSLSWSPEGQSLVAGLAQGGVRAWEVKTRDRLAGINGRVADLQHVAVSNDQRLIAVGSFEGVDLFDARSGAHMRRLNNIGSYPVWNSSGTLLASRTWDGKVTILESQTGKSIQRIEAPVLALAWSNDGTKLAGGGLQKLFVWDTADWKTVREFSESKPVFGYVLWSPDDTKLAVGHDRDVQIWDTKRLEKIHEFQIEPQPLTALGWSPDGASLAVGQAQGLVELRETASGAQLDTLNLLSTNPIAFDWSSDGSSLAIGCDDGTIRVWNLGTGGVRRQASGVRMQHFSPKGDFALYDRKVDQLSSSAEFYRVQNGASAGRIVILGEGAFTAIGPDGHFRGSPLVERHLVYVAQTDAGQQIFTAQEFEQRFGWRNDPEKVRLLDAAE